MKDFFQDKEHLGVDDQVYYNDLTLRMRALKRKARQLHKKRRALQSKARRLRKSRETSSSSAHR